MCDTVLTLLLILESLSLSSLVNTFEQWVIRRSLGGEMERVPLMNLRQGNQSVPVAYCMFNKMLK